MLNTKLNLYNPDWIELVFTNRNKSYGAFELRQHYAATMLKAMGIGFTTVIAAALLYNVSLKKSIDFIPPTITETTVDLKKLKLRNLLSQNLRQANRSRRLLLKSLHPLL